MAQWEDTDGSMRRIAVPGGWLYRTSGGMYHNSTMTFVPLPPAPPIPHGLGLAPMQEQQPTYWPATGAPPLAGGPYKPNPVYIGNTGT